MKEYEHSPDEERVVDLSDEPAEPTAPATLDPDEKIEVEDAPDVAADDDSRPA